MADRHDPSYYARFKRWCDKYFWIPYRKEARGIGGIFFDDLSNKPKDQLFQFVTEAAENFSTGYLTLGEFRTVDQNPLVWRDRASLLRNPVLRGVPPPHPPLPSGQTPKRPL